MAGRPSQLLSSRGRPGPAAMRAMFSAADTSRSAHQAPDPDRVAMLRTGYSHLQGNSGACSTHAMSHCDCQELDAALSCVLRFSGLTVVAGHHCQSVMCRTLLRARHEIEARCDGQEASNSVTLP
ncbi:hypothetical protein HaLaN_28052 [Haematococcus lacustris]|uniref:Uncharacterized protein n=1 Tax=Haematococcus lacustris TaxID=44745 RepID=A0A6A0A9Q7_HAELA|nr:hypothetical protein HaLaN_28052 [Haematococcus lacustris]